MIQGHETPAVLLQALDPATMSEGAAIVIIGLLGLLLWAAVQLRNPAGIVMWGITVLTFVTTALYGLRAEMLWLAIMGTAILVVVGAAARMMRGGGR